MGHLRFFWYTLYITVPFVVIPSVSAFPKCDDVIACECEGLVQITGVMCHNVTDFSHLSLKLRDGSLFDINETYEITLTGGKYLPSRMLEGLIVFRLYIDNEDIRNMSVDAFEDVLRLRRLHVMASSLDSIPNLQYISDSLRHLNFDNSKLTSLTTEVQNLPLLEELTLRKNSIRSIGPDALNGTDIIKFLDFSNNLLESLPSDLLDSQSNLIKLVLAFNRLTTVHGLLRIARPQFVLLSHNNLTNADDIIKENMTSLVTLDISHNQFTKLSNNSFNGKLYGMRFLFLDHCYITNFDVDHFQTLTSLNILDLSGNVIESIPNKTIAIGINLQLLLDDNKISSFEAEITYKTKRFYMSGNRMRYLGSTLQLTQLVEVEMNRNLIEALNAEDLRGMHGTQNLLLSDNLIERIDSEVFFDLRNDLQNLDLSKNLIRCLNSSVRYQSRLKSLNVSRNLITSFEEAEFIGLNELSELYMQDNNILKLGGQLHNMPQLLYLIVRNNNITTITMDQLPKSIQFLYFAGNPLKCNCHIMPFLEYTSSEESNLQTDVSYCTTAQEYNRSSIEWYDPCASTCSCHCAQDVNGSYVAVDCHDRNLTWIPGVFTREYFQELPENRTKIILGQNRNRQFHVMDSVRSLDLESNSILSLDTWIFPYNLKVLKLANNTLTTLPASVQNLKSLRMVTLSRNPWSCNCDAVNLKKWMTSKSDVIRDLNSTGCGSSLANPKLVKRLMTSLSDVDLCPSYVGLYASITFGILSVLLVLASATIAYHRYEMNIKVWLYSHGITWVKQNDLDRDKQFEAFISYSHEDVNFVHDVLVAGLEQKVPDVRLCLHDRHFLPGQFIHTNIVNAVNSSKRTVLVLTKKFLESEWCLLEFRAAHLKAMEDKVTRIIVIKVDDLPEEDIDPALSVYLKSTTYIEWGEKYFWQKLIYTIPEPPERPKTPMYDGEHCFEPKRELVDWNVRQR